MFTRLPLLSFIALGALLAFVACSVHDTPASSLSSPPPPALVEAPVSVPVPTPVTVITPEEKQEIAEEVAKIEPVDDPADPGRTAPEAEEATTAEKVLTPSDFPEYAPEPAPPPAANFAALREDCKNTCCLASVIFMETGNHALAGQGEGTSPSCPSGQVANSLKCPSSYHWCESAMVSANP